MKVGDVVRVHAVGVADPDVPGRLTTALTNLEACDLEEVGRFTRCRKCGGMSGPPSLLRELEDIDERVDALEMEVDR